MSRVRLTVGWGVAEVQNGATLFCQPVTLAIGGGGDAHNWGGTLVDAGDP